MKGRRAPILALLLALLLVLPGCEPLNQALAAPALDEDFSLSDIPAFSGQPYVVVGDNTPQFPEEDLVPVSFEDYSPWTAWAGAAPPTPACRWTPCPPRTGGASAR